jgi:membrane fusion protein (multidrug efflux system)
MSNNYRQQAIYPDHGQVHTPEGPNAESTSKATVIVKGLKSLTRRKKSLLAPASIVFTLTAAWLIRGSVLYERTDDAQGNARIIPLSARIAGQVQQVSVIEGQLVHAGDVLAVIDQRDYSIALLEALANLAYAESSTATVYVRGAITINSAYGGLNAARAAVKNASTEVDAAEHQLRADEAVLKQAPTDAATTGTVTKADQQILLRAQARLEEAITNLRNAQTAPQQASLANAETQAADFQVSQLRAQLDRAQLHLSYTIIHSPVTGIVGRRRLEIGEGVSIGQDLIDIMSLDDVWVTAKLQRGAACPLETRPAGGKQIECVPSHVEGTRDKPGWERRLGLQSQTAERRNG